MVQTRSLNKQFMLCLWRVNMLWTS